MDTILLILVENLNPTKVKRILANDSAASQKKKQQQQQ